MLMNLTYFALTHSPLTHSPLTNFAFLISIGFAEGGDNNNERGATSWFSQFSARSHK